MGCGLFGLCGCFWDVDVWGMCMSRKEVEEGMKEGMKWIFDEMPMHTSQNRKERSEEEPET